MSSGAASVRARNGRFTGEGGATQGATRVKILFSWGGGHIYVAKGGFGDFGKYEGHVAHPKRQLRV